MFINDIILRNFRIYKGDHRISFEPGNKKNVYVISGDNGFGKTTILTSLVWCLYGKLMGDVDEKFKREIADSLGYKNFAITNLNKSLLLKSSLYEIGDDEKNSIIKNGYLNLDPLHSEFKAYNEYSVSVVLSGVFLPTVQCDKLTITRSYDVFLGKESISILVDGKENELTKEVGPEIFINDFILSREIAKFFFFDSEKIVSLAEMKSIEDKRKLSIAYSEVLGIKKYEDLKNNLENLRIKFRRKSADLNDRNKLNKLLKECEDLEKLMDLLKNKQINNDVEILNKRQISEQYQEKLIREGNGISVEDLIKAKALKDELKSKDIQIKNKLKELLELAPFAIAGKKFINTYNQVILEKSNIQGNYDNTKLNDRIKKIQKELSKRLKNKSNGFNNTKVSKIIEEVFNDYLFANSPAHENTSSLLDFTSNESEEFKSIYENIKFSYNHIFRQLVKDDKNNKIFLSKTVRKISMAESNENDLLIKEIRSAKAKVDKGILDLEKDNRKISEDIGSFQRELTIKNKLKAELSKKVSVDESDKLKDETAARLIIELDEFLVRLKTEKKGSLEFNIKHELNRLMHKSDFIDSVVADIKGDIIDINLFDKEKIEIKKEKLSKGEQQLYATAILKALVDESEIKFPIFIDSPLQKFDKKHSNKIVTEFYPSISEQVVVFPLLGKELSADEYSALLPCVQGAYVIQNQLNYSLIQEIVPETLFNNIQEIHVYSYKDIKKE
ncbi:MAG: AAA family ATPase [Bacteroidales bacterium]|nr:AAA family ATPase [Bacteroidales bacterium]